MVANGRPRAPEERPKAPDVHQKAPKQRQRSSKVVQNQPQNELSACATKTYINCLLKIENFLFVELKTDLNRPVLNCQRVRAGKYREHVNSVKEFLFS
jgi:hypothetical protein